jgi:polar amino acid transport system substrate-binding protein
LASFPKGHPMQSEKQASRRRRRTTLTALLAAAALAVAACSGSSGSNSSGSGKDALKTVVDRGTVRVGECMGLPPYATYKKDNKPEGYDIDIANELGKGLGVKVEIVNLDAAARIPALQSGKVDVVLCNTTRTLERIREVDFTSTYNVSGSIILSKKGSGIDSLKSLDGKKVAIPKGTPYAPVVTAAAPKAEIINFDSAADGVTAVKQGQADAIVEDSGQLQYQAKLDSSLQITSESVIGLYYNSFAVAKGNQEWLNYLNEFIFELNTSGQNADMYKKWFGVTPPFKLNPSF